MYIVTMNNVPKIGVLCNSTLAIPGLQALMSNRLLTAVGVPDKVHDGIYDIKNVSASFGMKVDTFSKSSLNENLSEWISHNKLDIVFVFTFPWKIGDKILNIPSLGFINFHFGILPQYRGADAIFWPIKKREPFGGISVHKMDEQFDAGPLYHVEKVPLNSKDTYGTYSTRLAIANAHMLEKIFPALISGGISGKEQDVNDASYYHKPGLSDVCIKWEEQSAEDILALVNACNPWNKGAQTIINNTPVKIIEVWLSNATHNNKEGTIIKVDDEGIHIAVLNKKVLIAKIIAVNEGIFSAQIYAEIYNIREGLMFGAVFHN